MDYLNEIDNNMVINLYTTIINLLSEITSCSICKKLMKNTNTIFYGNIFYAFVHLNKKCVKELIQANKQESTIKYYIFNNTVNNQITVVRNVDIPAKDFVSELEKNSSIEWD